MAKIMKKKDKTKIVSLRSGIADNSADTKILKPSIPDIVLSGLNTLNTLMTFKFSVSPAITKGRYPLMIITKSKIFHESLK